MRYFATWDKFHVNCGFEKEIIEVMTKLKIIKFHVNLQVIF